jgi:hypothetical protein
MKKTNEMFTEGRTKLLRTEATTKELERVNNYLLKRVSEREYYSTR